MKYIEAVRQWCKDGGSIRMIVLLGLSAMALLLLSGLPETDKAESEDMECAVTEVQDPAAEYAAETERRLTALLKQMDGVGAVSVMVTVCGTKEQIYAEEARISESDHSSQSEYTYVITKSGGEESALVSQTRYPKVAGVAVLCTGGGSAAVQERVILAVSTVLGIPSSDIYVGRQTPVPTS